MKNGSIRIGATLLLFGSFLLTLSCGETPQTTNTAQQKDVDLPTNASKTPEIPGESKACGIVDLEERRTAVENRIAQNIVNDGDLREMYRGNPAQNKPKIVDFKVVAYPVANGPGYLVVYIAGRINKNGKMDDFVNRIKNVMKANCVHRVVFLPPGTDLELAAERHSGFEWDYCEYPKKACSDGSCQETCPGKYMEANTNTNTSGNSNSGNTSNQNTNNVSNSNLGNRRD